MLALTSTRTGAKSGAIFAALGEICGLGVKLPEARKALLEACE